MAEQKITEKDLQRLEEVFNPQCDVCVLVRAYRAQQQTIEELKRKNGKMARDLAVNQDTINTLRRTIEAQTVEIKRLNSQEIIDVYRNSAIEANAHSARLMQEIAQLKARYELSNPHLPEYTVKVSEEDDPMKVNMREQPHNWYEEMLARKHNALVDEVRRESKMNYESYAVSIELHTERIMVLEEKVSSNDRGVADALDKAFAEIRALEATVNALLKGWLRDALKETE